MPKENHYLHFFCCYLISLCLLNAYADCTHCTGKSYVVSVSLLGLGGAEGEGDATVTKHLLIKSISFSPA